MMAAQTPEGKIKAQIKKVLDKRKPELYVYMPVPGGFGAPTLDYLGFYYGRGFAIEAKAPGKHPTDRQGKTINDIRAARVPAFVISGDTSLHLFEDWLDRTEEHYKAGPLGRLALAQEEVSRGNRSD